METKNDLRQQVLHRAMVRNTDATADVVIQLWQPLAFQLISIIGEGGFNALYARSLNLIHADFPWLVLGDARYSADVRFTDLEICLKRQSAPEANKASHRLLLTFTDLLASLIGEPLTLGILFSAWGGDASDLTIADKELPHD